MTPSPSAPRDPPARFRATVHGTVFAGRDRHLVGLRPGDPLVLIPDPPGDDEPAVWVHLATGDPLGHLPPEIGTWLAPWLRAGGRARAWAYRIGGADVPSWRRLILDIRCLVGDEDMLGATDAVWAG